MKQELAAGDYDLGLAFDGDGDRLGLYTPQGKFIENDVTAAIIAQDIAQKNPNATIVLNVSTTMAVLEIIKAAGGQPILWKTGFPLISEKMRQEKAIFGGEISGHFFFADRYYGYDDAFYAALRLLEILDQKGESFEQLAARLPAYPQIPEFRLPVPEGQDKYQLAEEIGQDIKKDYPQAQLLTIDGLRFSFTNSWGLIRPSNTEPLITGRAEGKTKEDLAKIKTIINQQLTKHNFTASI